MSRGKELAKNTGILFIGRFATQFLSFFLLPIYTTLLSTDDYGMIDLFSMYIGLIIPIVTLCIDHASVKYMIEANGDEKILKKIVSNVFSFLLYIIIGLSIVFFIFNSLIIIEYKYFLLLNLVSTIISSNMLQFYRGIKDLKTYTFASFISSITVILLNILFVVVMKLGLAGVFTAIFISNILTFIFLLFKNKFYARIKLVLPWNLDLKKLFESSVPIIPNNLSGWILSYSDRIILTMFLGISSTGIIGVAYKFSAIFTSVYRVFYLSWLEMVLQHLHDEDGTAYFNEMFNKMFRIFASMSILLIIGVAYVFPIMINDKFLDAYYQIPILIVAVLFEAGMGMLGTVSIAFNKSFEISKLTVYAAIINIIVDLLLVKYIGIYAASISTLAGYFIVFVLRMRNVKKYIDFTFSKSFLVILGLILICLYLIYCTRNYIIITACIPIFILYLYIINRNFLKEILAQIKVYLEKR